MRSLSIVLLFLSALLVIWVKHEHRRSVGELSVLVSKKRHAQVEWSQLVLERSTLLSYQEIESKAKNVLGMHHPTQTERVVIER